MASDPNFEDRLFQLYGEPSAASSGLDIAERLLRELDRDRRVRNRVLIAAASAGTALGVAAAALLAGSFMEQIAVMTGAATPVLWLALLAAALGLSAAAVRLTEDGQQ